MSHRILKVLFFTAISSGSTSKSSSMRVVSSSDVSLLELRHFSNELRTELQVEVEDNQIFLRSAEPPSWVALLANADWWVKGLAAYAALFVAELVKEGAKE